MTPADLRELADRCAAAVGPDRELDAAIYMAAHPKIRLQFCRPLKLKRVWPTTNGGRDVFWYETLNGCMGGVDDAPYTASLDAAMSLVLEGWLFEVGRWPRGCATVQAPDYNEDTYNGVSEYVEAATPALALCAAALRARHLQSEGNR